MGPPEPPEHRPGDAGTSGPPDVDALVARLRERVEERRRDGRYPPGLEEELDRHFHHIAVRGVRDRLQRLREALAEADDRGRRLSAAGIPLGSERRLGSAVHRGVARLVGRQTEGALEQVRDYADALAEAHRALLLAHADLVARVDELRDRFVALDDTRGGDGTGGSGAGGAGGAGGMERALVDLRVRVEALEAAEASRHVALPPPEAPDDEERTVRALRRLGGRERVVWAGPDWMAELLERGEVAAERTDDLLELLRGAPPGELGGVAAAAVLERAAPAEQFELAALLASRLAPGGLLVADVASPWTLRGPGAGRAALAHPAHLLFLLREAGFEALELDTGEPERRDPGSVTADDLAAAVFGAASFTLAATRP